MKIKQAKEDKRMAIIGYILMAIQLFITFYPLYFIVIASFSSPALINSGSIKLIPRGINFAGYSRILSYPYVWRAYAMTAYYTLGGTLINLGLTLPVAYVMTRKRFLARNLITKFLTFTMFFGGGLIPTYILVTNIGLYNTPVTMLLISGISVYNVIICRASMQNSIPEEMFEAASIDGCNHFNYFFGFVLPLSKPIIAVMTLYYGVTHWNDYMNALIYLSDSKLFPLQLVLRNIIIRGELMLQDVATQEEALKFQEEADLIKYGLIVIASAPLLLVYPFIQKFFTRGIMIGSIKG